MKDTSKETKNKKRVIKIIGIAVALLIVVGIIAGRISDNSSTSSYATVDSGMSEGYSGARNLEDTNSMGLEADSFSMAAKSADEGSYATEDASSTSNETYSSTSSSDIVNRVNSGKKLITNISIDAETKDFAEVSEKLQKDAYGFGGYVENSYYSKDDYNNNAQQLNITIRIPYDKVDSYVSEVSSLVNVTRNSRTTTDVTLNYYDSKTRKESYETEKKALDRMLAQADDVDTALAIQNRLADLQYQIDSITTDLNTIDNDVNYSTVKIYLTEVVDYTHGSELQQSMWDKMKDGFMNSIKSIGKGLQSLIIVLFTNIPQLVICALIIFAIVKIVKKVSKKGDATKEKGATKEKVVKDLIKDEDPGKTEESTVDNKN